MAPADITNFEVISDYVLMDPSIHSLIRKSSGKFTPRLLGSYLIVNQIRDKYSCRKCSKGLPHYSTSPIPIRRNFGDPRTIIAPLRRDRGDNEIDKTIAHRSRR